jgi:hypothetical protein
VIRKQFNFISIIIFLLFNNSLIGQNDNSYKILNRVKKNLSSKNIHYKFIIENNLQEINNSINGNLYLSDEKYVLLTNNIEQIFDGEKTYTIIHENEEVLIDNKENEILSLKPNLLFDFIDDKYKLSMIKNNKNTSIIKAQDNTNPGQFYEISINLNDLSIIYIKQESYNVGYSNIFKTISYSYNISLPLSFFKFDKEKYKNYYLSILD